MSGNYPPGVSAAHPYFNPPTCPNCHTEAEPGYDCPECGTYLWTEEDHAEARADQIIDARRDAAAERRARR